MTRRLLFCFVFVLVTVAAQAQQLPPGKWWRRPEIVRQLNLSAEQQDRLEAAFRGAAEDLIDLKAEVEKANLALRSELDRTDFDRQALLRAGQRVEEARGKLFLRELAMLADMRAVLNPQQWGRMREALERRNMPHADGQPQPPQNPPMRRPQGRRP